MGVILQGILGGFSGKVGPVVGGKWKDIDYMRGYVVPANPNTAGQQAVRTKFAELVARARTLLSTILQPFWDPFVSNMSGFNRWISLNYALANSSGVISNTAIMAQGTLEPTDSNTSTYNTATGEVLTTFNVTTHGNGLATDNIVLVVYDTVNKDFYVANQEDPRSEGSIETTIPTGLTATNVIAWVFFYRGTGSEMIVSDSLGDVCAAA